MYDAGRPGGYPEASLIKFKKNKKNSFINQYFETGSVFLDEVVNSSVKKITF